MVLKRFSYLLSVRFFQEFEKNIWKDARHIFEIKAEDHVQRHKRCSDTGKEISYHICGSLVKEGLWFWSIA